MIIEVGLSRFYFIVDTNCRLAFAYIYKIVCGFNKSDKSCEPDILTHTHTRTNMEETTL